MVNLECGCNIDDLGAVTYMCDYHESFIEDEDDNDWEPGDPCGNCGSTKTRWGDIEEGAVCATAAA